MSLPKRDGVHNRYYLIHKPDTSPEVLAEADLCIQDVLNGTARENHSAYPTVVRNHNGTPFLPDQLLERYLFQFPLKGFPYEDAVAFCDALQRLVGWKEIDYTLRQYIEKQVQDRYFEVGEREDGGWKEIDYTLRQYIEKQVQDRYFEVGEREDGFTVFPPCTVWPELRPEDVDEGLLRFACYVAVCYTVYGLSFEYLTTEHILGLVSQLRPDMVKELKTNGSGKLPPNIQKRKTPAATPSSSAGRRSSTCPSPACPRRASTSCLPARCGTPASMSEWRIMLGWPCRRTSGTTISLMSPVLCLAPSPCLPWGWRGRSGWGWCATTWTAVTTSTLRSKKSSSTHFSKNMALPPSPCRCWSTESSPCRI